MIKMKKNILAENMKRFNTKNLNENIKTNSDFIKTVETIMDQASSGQDMTDYILAELGDFYNDVTGSNDAELKQLYTQLRMSADGTVALQAKHADKLFKYLNKSSDNSINTDSSLSSKNIKTNADFIETVETIMVGSLKGENMTDYILAELGDFYNDVTASNNTELKQLYTQLRMTADETPKTQSAAAVKLFSYLHKA